MNGPKDFMKMEALIANKKIDSVAIIGGGLLGTELAYSMALQSPKTGLKITQILNGKGKAIIIQVGSIQKCASALSSDFVNKQYQK